MVGLSSRYLKFVYQRDDISLFYQFETDDNTDVIGTSIPDGCIDIIFHHRPDGSETDADYYGTDLAPHSMKCYPGCVHFGVRFQPGVTPFCSSMTMGELIDKIVPFDQATPRPMSSLLPKAIARCKSFRDKIDCFLRFMSDEASNLASDDSGSEMLTYLKQSIVATRGTMRVRELAQQVGYSVSYINKLFSGSMAISAKKFSQIVRYQSLLNCLYTNGRLRSEPPDWGMLAQRFGYYDQSHLINSFKQFSNRTPGAFLQELNGMGFNARLKIEQNPELQGCDNAPCSKTTLPSLD